MTEERKTINVFTRDDSAVRSGGGIREIDVDQLRQNLSGLLGRMGDVVGGLPEAIAGFGIQTVTLTVEVTGKGQIGLLGTGAEFGGKGGLTLTLKRNESAAAKKE